MPNKSTLFKAIGHATMRGCTLAVGAILAFFFIASVAVDYTPGMNLTSFITFLIFSLVISYSRGILRIGTLPTPVRRLIHFVLIGIAYFFVLLVTTKAYGIGYVIYAVIYALLFGISALVKHFLFRESAPAIEPQEIPAYKSRFS